MALLSSLSCTGHVICRGCSDLIGADQSEKTYTQRSRTRSAARLKRRWKVFPVFPIFPVFPAAIIVARSSEGADLLLIRRRCPLSLAVVVYLLLVVPCWMLAVDPPPLPVAVGRRRWPLSLAVVVSGVRRKAKRRGRPFRGSAAALHMYGYDCSGGKRGGTADDGRRTTKPSLRDK